MSTATTVALFPELAAEARRRRLQCPYDTWVRLRSLGGPGWLDWQAALVGLQTAFGVARSTVYAWLRSDPQDIFWVEGKLLDGRRAIFLVGIDRVHAQLGHPRLSRRVDLPVEQFRGVRGRNKSNVKGFIAARQRHRTLDQPNGEPTRPMSRRSIAQHTSYSPSSQRRYQRLDHDIHSYKNVLIRTEAPTPEEALLKGMWRSGGQWYEPLPNSYATHGAEVGGKKLTHRLNSKLAHVGEPMTAWRRRYFHRVRAFMRARGDGERFLRLGSDTWATYWSPPDLAVSKLTASREWSE